MGMSLYDDFSESWSDKRRKPWKAFEEFIASLENEEKFLRTCAKLAQLAQAEDDTELVEDIHKVLTCVCKVNRLSMEGLKFLLALARTVFKDKEVHRHILLHCIAISHNKEHNDRLQLLTNEAKFLLDTAHETYNYDLLAIDEKDLVSEQKSELQVLDKYMRKIGIFILNASALF